MEGKLLNVSHNNGKYNQNIYLIQTKDNEKIRVWGKNYLDVLMDAVEVGDYIRITYNGVRKTSSGNYMMIYNVERRDTNE